ncbi:MAG: ATP-dependent RNA helicase DbpA [Candidatus Thioglobus sp.]|nr:MAG: ATP-dependent RNA helicase DbpA [Candidatus Thioglobus sp.]
MSDTDFSALKLNSDLLKNLSSLGYKSMTTIQELSLPLILAGEDVIGQGKTGSGKTAAFGLGLLQKLDTSVFKAQAIVLCPTRELAGQVAVEIRKLARAVNNIKVLELCGGTPLAPQINSLAHGAHIIIGTPGRIEEHLRKDSLQLANIKTLVLDEADRMLDMGFKDTIESIVAKIPTKRQTLLFSATYPAGIALIAENIMQNPTMVEASAIEEKLSIKQYFHLVNGFDERLTALRLLLAKHCPNSALVFCNTKIDTQNVADELANYGFYALAIHGDLDQRQRDQALIRFANGSANVLVATDVAARGLDITDLDMVINFNLAHDFDVHTHRIGRTGRAGKSGVTCTFFGDKETHKLAAFDIDLESAEPLPNDNYLDKALKKPLMTTLKIDGGKKQKLRPGDIVGGLTGKSGIPFDKIGKINISSNWSFVAIETELVKTALQKIQTDKLKGKNFRVRILS